MAVCAKQAIRYEIENVKQNTIFNGFHGTLRLSDIVFVFRIVPACPLRIVVNTPIYP